MKNLARSTLFFASLIIAQNVTAQILAPATSEDLNEFDRQLQQTQVEGQRPTVQKEKNAKSDQFGAAVSDEAKRIRPGGGGDKRSMGQLVREQRRQGSGGSGKDALTSSPANNDRGNSGSAPGHSGNKKK